MERREKRAIPALSVPSPLHPEKAGRAGYRAAVSVFNAREEEAGKAELCVVLVSRKKILADFHKIPPPVKSQRADTTSPLIFTTEMDVPTRIYCNFRNFPACIKFSMGRAKDMIDEIFVFADVAQASDPVKGIHNRNRPSAISIVTRLSRLPVVVNNATPGLKSYPEVAGTLYHGDFKLIADIMEPRKYLH